MMKRKEFILGAAVGLVFAAAATAGGVIDWPGANASEASGRLIPSAGASGLAFAPPQGAPLSFADIFDQVSPAVVQIDVETPIERPRGGMIPIPGLPGFGFQAPETQEPGEEEEPQTAQGAGSGFFISADGFIVTNNHVVANATKITVKLSDGRELAGRLVGRDADTDLAVVKVEGSDFKFVSFEEAAEPRVGDWVIAVGNPFGLGGTVTSGIVSASGRDIGSGPYDDFIQIDAAVNKGNSGGPAFDTSGEVMGVNTAIYSPSGGSVGIAFSIPASTVQTVITQLKDKGTVSRGWIGVQIQPVTQDIADSLGLKKAEGALVAEPQADGPAAKAGIQSGDVITAVNGTPVKDARELARTIGGFAPGNSVKINVMQKGQDKVLTLTLGQLPNTVEAKADLDQGDRGNSSRGTNEPRLGLTVAPSSSVAGAGKDGVVVTEVDPKSPAAERGFKEGDVILEVAGKNVTSPGDVREAIVAARNDNKNSVLIRVRSGGSSRFVAVPLAKG